MGNKNYEASLRASVTPTFEHYDRSCAGTEGYTGVKRWEGHFFQA